MHGSLYRELMDERLSQLRAEALRRSHPGPRRATVAVARVLRAAATRLDGRERPAPEPQCL